MIDLRACFEYMASQWSDETLLVTSAGHSSGTWWDVTRNTDRAFYLTASMSLSSMFAAGIAVGFPDRPVWAFSGDGAFVMNPGMLFVERRLNLPNLKHFLISNRCYGSTEEVDIPFARDADYAAIARGAGIERVYHFDNLDSLKQQFGEAVHAPGHTFIVLEVERLSKEVRTASFDGPELKFSVRTQYREADRAQDFHRTMIMAILMGKPVNPISAHSRATGNPFFLPVSLVPRFRGDERSLLIGLRLILLSLVVVVSGVFVPASAQSVEEFYRGKTIRVIVPTGPGGTYALFGNFINEAMSRHIPGNPKLVMQFIPSGIQAMNYLYNVPAKDGLTIGMLSQTSGIIQVMTPEHVKYDLRQFAAIGLFAQLNAVMTVSERTTIKSVEDLKTTPVSLGATDTSSYQYVIPTIINRYLGTKNKVVTGYKGIAETTLAMERGEVDGVFTSWLAIKEQRQRESWKGERGRVLVQVGYDKEPDLDTPMLDSFAPNEQAKQAFAFIASFSVLSRCLIAPPGIPQDRLDALRKAADAVLVDKDFVASLAKRNLPFSPLSWAVQQQIMDRTVSTSVDLVK